jgi:aspartate racemase
MKTIGLIGGMSWESSLEYYRIVNEVVKSRLGGLHSAQCIMYSVDFAEIEILQRQGKWDEATNLMIDAARHVEKGGADFFLICTNTMHLMADEVQDSVTIPLIHIADVTALAVKERGIKTIGLLGTKFTMEEDFYRGRLIQNHGLEVLIPEEEGERDNIHDIIFDELCLGTIEQSSREQFITVMEKLAARGAEGIILGCTEIGLLTGDEDSRVPLFDTTKIHAEAAALYALED